jgi:hypothetical protein
LKRFNLTKNWRLVEPYLNDPDVVNAVDAGMYTSTYFNIKEFKKNFPKATGYGGNIWGCQGITMPSQMSHGDYYAFHRMVPGKPSAYKPYGKCHFIAPFCKKIAEKLFPDQKWAILFGITHSLVVSIYPRDISFMGFRLTDNKKNSWGVNQVIDILNEDAGKNFDVFDSISFAIREGDYDLVTQNYDAKIVRKAKKLMLKELIF